jgi:hypothetical protein
MLIQKPGHDNADQFPGGGFSKPVEENLVPLIPGVEKKR